MGKLLVLLGLAIAAWIWWRRQQLLRLPMGPAEARALLGVGERASLQEIRDAHRRLIARVHPDAGGSVELATRVNAARDALVRELNRRTPRAS
jgi:DnaJ homolog subfamily C member 19